MVEIEAPDRSQPIFGKRCAADFYGEYAVGRGRIDLCLRWPHPEGVQRFAIKMKVRRDSTHVPQGLDQLAAYLDRLGLKEGTLVVFDAREDGPAVTERNQETFVDHQGHQIRVLVL